MTETPFDNVEAIEAWNTVLFDKFLRFRATVTTGLGRHGAAVMARHPPPTGGRVLDLGCGFGDTTLALAGLVGPGGEAVGVDAAPRFIDAARRDAAGSGIGNARFEVADVEKDALGGPYDLAFSRFGTMFFANPVAALRNVRQSLRPGGLLAMCVWRNKRENPFLHEVEETVLALVPRVDKGEQVTCGPGPFSMASPDLVSAQLVGAGFRRIAFERFDADIKVADNVDDAIEFALALGPAGEIIRLAGELGEQRKPAVAAALRELLTGRARPDGVFGGSSS